MGKVYFARDPGLSIWPASWWRAWPCLTSHPCYPVWVARWGTLRPPRVLLGLLLYGYATGVFSSRKIERATYEAVPFRFMAGNLHPDHDTLATFRRTFLPELKKLFVQVLLLAQEAGILTLGTISLDGTKIHADARHSQSR